MGGGRADRIGAARRGWPRGGGAAADEVGERGNGRGGWSGGRGICRRWRGERGQPPRRGEASGGGPAEVPLSFREL